MNFTAFRDWFGRQAPRDQRILRIGAVAVGALLVLLLILPLQRELGRARARLAEQQLTLDYMRQVGPALAAAGPGTAAQPLTESFVVLIDRTARESGLAQALTGSPPAGNNAFRVTLENADFNLLLTWMQQLASRYGVRVEAATVTASGAPGKVNATVQMRPPA